MDTKNPVNLFNGDLDLESYLSETVSKAGRNDERYNAAKQRVSEAKNRIPKLRKILDVEEASELSLDECKVLIEYLLADNRLAQEECRICYLRGFVDGIGHVDKVFPSPSNYDKIREKGVVKCS